MNRSNPQIQTVQFIPASAAFKGLKRLWNEFAESNPPFSWGGSNRTLVTAEAVIDHLDGCANATPRLVKCLRARLKNISPDLQLFVDLEN